MTRLVIRPATEDDLPQIAELFPRAFGSLAPRTGPAWTAYIRRVLFEHPWRDLRFPSLACDGPDGSLIGFLGVLPRRMRAGGAPATLAVSHHLMVDPRHRRTLAGVSLLKAFLSGPQDLSLCEPDDDVCRIWEALGGSSSLLHSFHWVRHLRPASYLARKLGPRLPGPLAAGLGMGASLIDPLSRRLSGLALAPSVARSEPLSVDGLRERIEASSRSSYLRPDYAAEDLAWLMDLLAHKAGPGRLRTRLVRGARDEALGHYLYYVPRSGAGNVVQVGAEPGAFAPVIDDLLHDALDQGVAAVTGRLDPPYAQALSDRHAVFRRRANRLMFATARPELELAIRAGNAFLTRMEIEWWIPFAEDART